MLRKYALVTGASRGIGAAIARELAKELDGIFICSDQSEDELMRTADDISAITHLCRVIPVICNVTDPADVKEMFEIVNQYSYDQGLDYLINNAGISLGKTLEDTTDEDWHHMIESNLSSVFYCCRTAVPDMKRNGHGKILNISSVWGQTGCALESAYSATKGGVDALTRALAKELAPSNIQVNALSLGIVGAGMNSDLTDEEKDSISRRIPSGRLASETEAAKMASAILTAPDYLTGQIIRMDGGLM